MAFLGLGLLSFGGPAAHLGYFRETFINRKKWLTDAEFAQLVALSQFLPGPGSSQVGLSIGLLRAGWIGALAAFVAFTLPSVEIGRASCRGSGDSSGEDGGWRGRIGRG